MKVAVFAALPTEAILSTGAPLQLPIESHLPRLSELVRAHPIVLLEASPGSGKTTLVPLHLLKQVTGKILVLEPRRLATRLAAQRVASLLGETLGQTVGHMVRFENTVGPDTRLVFLTEGTFLRYLQGNPKLEGVGAVVLDEFHERHLTTDMAWGLFLELFKNARAPKLLVMSATLDEAPLRRHVPHLQKMRVETPVFPLEIRYAPKEGEWGRRTWDKKVTWGVQEALALSGDILVFLPGIGEIRKVRELLEPRLPADEFLLLSLHGQESSPEHLVMKPQPQRKIILASNVAESSVTIPGVRVVVDLGLTREAVFSPWSGLSELVTLPCSRASCIQRAGRAARTAPGACIRLFTEQEFNAREAFSRPEVLKTNLDGVMLELAGHGLKPETFPWPDPPEASAWQNARALLTRLQAIEGDKLTRTGSSMRELPLPSRAARVWVEARDKGSEDAFRETTRLLAQWLEPGDSRKLQERLKAAGKRTGQETHAEKFFLAGFPERVARARAEDVVTADGHTLRLGQETKNSWDPRRPWWLVLDVNGISKQATRLLPLEEEWLWPLAAQDEETFFDEKRGKMVKRTSWRLGSLVLSSKEEVQQGATGAPGTLAKATESWLAEFRASEEYRRWEIFQQHLFPQTALAAFEWELFREEFLLEERLPDDAARREFLRRLREELQLHFDPSFRLKLDEQVPARLKLHERRTCDVHYDPGQPPWIEAHVQDFYGRSSHPTLLGGKLPLTIRLWGPHTRTLQITGDLPGFWAKGYAELAKEMRREYPRHFWPDDPTTAEPKLHLKPRR